MDNDGVRARFLRAVSHDLRQPLHALMLYLDALDRRVPEGEARAVLGKASEAAQALVSMFESLIELSRLEAGKVTPEIGDVSVQDLFDDAIAREPCATAEPTTLHVKSDPILLDQILHHLVSNAVKHGGGAARLSAVDRNGAVELAVSDEGPGIPPEDRARVFDEFQRLDGAPQDGLGLGLTIVRKLADLLGHGVELRSASGGGATFVVRAPRS
jgi:signal transduction histidine kinase